MILKTSNLDPVVAPVVGAQWERCFAWLPREVNGRVIWLEPYERRLGATGPSGEKLYAFKMAGSDGG